LGSPNEVCPNGWFAGKFRGEDCGDSAFGLDFCSDTTT